MLSVWATLIPGYIQSIGLTALQDCLSVCPARAADFRIIKMQEIKIGVNIPQARSHWCVNYSGLKVGCVGMSALGGHSFPVNIHKMIEVRWTSCTWQIQNCILYITVHCCWSIHYMLYVHMVEMSENYANGPADIDAMGELVFYLDFTSAFCLLTLVIYIYIIRCSCTMPDWPVVA